jgi:hypothetical protein
VRTANPRPVEWFDVTQNGERVFDTNPPLLNTALELPPGRYIVDVNRTQREATVQAGKKTILWVGELIVEGEPSGAFWYPMQGKERRLSSNPPILNSSAHLFPGTYTVFVHVSVGQPDTNLGEAEVKPGNLTVLKH